MNTLQSNVVFKAALYLRLSKDDENIGESSSISTQRNILREYVKAHGIVIADEYVDDGYSGTNYDRPGFRQMIQDIESGFINCVITKDLSRLGRNSAKTADLLDEYFPAHRIRYISVIEGYDTLQLTNGSIMTAPFMLLMNEMYARDISNKIRSSFQSKMEKGDYIGSFAPYGYQKDTENGNKNRLVIDNQVAHIVQEIFQMAADGFSPNEIAQHLNAEHIATPAVYRCSTRPYLDIANYSVRKEWTSSILCKMLRNRVYLGHTVQGKTTKVSFKSRDTQAKRKEDWIEVQHTHEPLVSEEMYNAVRSRCVSRRNPPTRGFSNIFAGVAKCADCKRNMTTAPSRKKGCTCNLSCGGYKTYGAKECSNHFMDYDLLYSIVLQELQYWLSLSDKTRDSIVKDLEQEQNSRKNEQLIGGFMQLLHRSERRIQEVSTLMKKAYEDYSFGRIMEKTYKTLSMEYDAEYQSLERTIAEMKKRLQPNAAESDLYRKFFSRLDEVTKIAALTPQLIKKMIDRIEVEQGVYTKDENGKRVKRQRIKIYYRFSEYADEAP